MKTRFVICFILCLIFAMNSCSPAKEEKDRIEPGETTSETVDAAKTHVGGCILAVPSSEVPEDLYQVTDVVPSEEYKPFTKKLLVYGITLIGRDDISDDFMRRVAKTITEMFPQNNSIDSELQKEVLRNLYRYRTVIPLFRDEEFEFSPEDREAWDLTTSQNSICDIIMEGVPGQVNEVVEHILHFVTDIGLHYTFTAEWGCTSKTSKIYEAMKEAIEKGHYNIAQYEEEDIEEEERLRVLIQEYAYWVIFTAWNLYEPYGPEAEWTGIRNPSDMMEKLPLSYELFEQTIPRVMAPPSRATLDKFVK
jgi:hypothetical protein